jgi:hypothetical protein
MYSGMGCHQQDIALWVLHGCEDTTCGWFRYVIGIGRTSSSRTKPYPVSFKQNPWIADTLVEPLMQMVELSSELDKRVFVPCVPCHSVATPQPLKWLLQHPDNASC